MEKSFALIELTLTVLLFGCLLQCSVVSSCSEKDRLVKDLTSNYVTAVEPDKSTLKVGLAFTCSRLDSATGDLVTNAWEKMSWTDKRLRWSPKDYNGIELIRLPSNLIWVPDLKLYNSMTPIVDRDHTMVIVTHDGSVIWIPPVLYRTLCTEEKNGSDLNCQFRLGSWTYDADTLKLELNEAPFDATAYLNATCPLAFESANAVIRTKHYPCCKEPYSHAEFNVLFKPKK